MLYKNILCKTLGENGLTSDKKKNKNRIIFTVLIPAVHPNVRVANHLWSEVVED